MREDLRDELRLLDAGDELELAAAACTALDLNATLAGVAAPNSSPRDAASSASPDRAVASRRPRLKEYEGAIRKGAILLGVQPRSSDDVAQLTRCWQNDGGRLIHS